MWYFSPQRGAARIPLSSEPGLQKTVGLVTRHTGNRDCLAQQKDVRESTLVVFSRHRQWRDVDQWKVVQIRRLLARKFTEKA